MSKVSVARFRELTRFSGRKKLADFLRELQEEAERTASQQVNDSVSFWLWRGSSAAYRRLAEALDASEHKSNKKGKV